MRPLSELFTCRTTLKFVNALAKLPQTQQVPSIASFKAPVCVSTPSLLAPIHSFTRQIISIYIVCEELLTQISLKSIPLEVCINHIKSFHQENFTQQTFFLSFFYFHCTLFVGLHDLGMNPGIFIQNTHLVCTYSTSLVCFNFFMDFNKICISTSPIIGCLVEHIIHMCSIRQPNFQHKANTSMYLRDTFTLQDDSFCNLDSLQMIRVQFQTHKLY